MRSVNTLLVAGIFAVAGVVSAEPPSASSARALVESQVVPSGMKIIKQFDQPETGLVGFVLTNKNDDPLLIYADPKGRFLVSGVVVDDKGVNLYARDAKQYVPKPDHTASYQAASQAHWIATGKLGASKVLYVFAEPNCSWCKKEWESLSKVKDVEVRWVMFGFNDAGENKVARILGAKNQAQALADNYTTGNPGNVVTNESEIKARENKLVAGKVKVNGTPALYFKTKDGVEFINGAVLDKKLDEMLAKISG